MGRPIRGENQAETESALSACIAQAGGTLPPADGRVKTEGGRVAGGAESAQPLGPRYLLDLPKLQKAIKQDTKVISQAELLEQ